jgi:RNA polymerase sigma-70 factor (ECF subfamily)
MGNQPKADHKKSENSAEEKTGVFSITQAFIGCQSTLRQFIAKYSLPSSHIDDIAQETFLRAYEAEKKHSVDQPRAFLFRIARNLILTEVTKKSHKITKYIEDFEPSEVLIGRDSLESEVEAHQKIGIYCEAVAMLPPQCRKVFLLKKVYGLSHKEIAARLDISVSTIEKHIARGLRQCNEVVQSRYQEIPDMDKTKSVTSVRASLGSLNNE